MDDDGGLAVGASPAVPGCSGCPRDVRYRNQSGNTVSFLRSAVTRGHQGCAHLHDALWLLRLVEALAIAVAGISEA